MILSVNQIHKSYGNQKVLNKVTFHIEKPEIIALVGPNGSGKSTLLNIITNIIKPDQGEITIFGRRNNHPEIFREVAFMQDNSVLYDYLTGYDHLQFIGNIQGISKEQIYKTAKRVGMDSYMNKKVSQYSLGMKQHLLLTLAILNQPKLLILDEPLNGLDPTSAINVRELVLELVSEGTTILLSSHNLAEIDRLTDHILFLKKGQIIDEDVSIHRKISYKIEVDNIERALFTLNDAGIVTTQKDKYLYIENIHIHDVFQILEKNRLRVLAIDREVTGTEGRYKNIFFENGDTIENSSV